MDRKCFYGSIEAGGTKFVCAVGNEDNEIVAQTSFPTEDPKTTLQKVSDFFTRNKVSAIGIGCFGPVNIDPLSEEFGEIEDTPKPGWKGFNVYQAMREFTDIPLYLTTDVNSSAYGEYKFGAAQGKPSCVYVTVGTGIGGGVIQNDEFVGSMTHLELGHSYANIHPSDLDFKGVCPYHGANCFEGLAAGPSIEARLKVKGELVKSDHEIWELEAYYLAQLAYNIRVNYSPEVVIFGGGVLAVAGLIDKVREAFKKINNGYVVVPDLENYLLQTKIPNNGSASLGNFALAKKALNKKSQNG